MTPRKKTGTGRAASKAPFLGRISTKWCMTCDVPVLRGKQCPKCNTHLVQPNIAPPGDVRPAFDYDIGVLRAACDTTFVEGTGAYLFPDGIAVLLNKVGGIDLDYQVIAHGEWVGNLRYDLGRRTFIFAPSRAGGLLVYKMYVESGRIVKDPAAPLPPKCIKYYNSAEPFAASGKNLLAPGIERLDTNAFPGDPCLVFTDNGLVVVGYYATGKQAIEAMMEQKHGLVGKPRYNMEAVPATSIDASSFRTSKRVTWDDVIEVNGSLLDENARKAVEFMVQTRNRFKVPVSVAYSGGKDSLATLILARMAFSTPGSTSDGGAHGAPGAPRTQGAPFSLMFADTGLEFPEVLQNVSEVVKWAGLGHEYYSRSAGDKFWMMAERFGPPARDFRFCCHILKASQVNEITEEIIARHCHGNNEQDKKVLVFLGQRQYESFSRSEDRRVYTNTYIPMQIAATPIRNWSALDEWLFLLREKHRDPGLPINPLYFLGHDRIGCFLCPAQSMAALAQVKKTHPNLYQRWDGFLDAYRKQQGYPEAWKAWGLWRFKRYKGQWEPVAKNVLGDVHEPRERGDVTAPAPGDERALKLYITKGISPCTAGGFSVKARFSLPLMLSELLPWFKIVDKRVRHDESSDVLYVYEDDLRFMLYSDGSLFLQSVMQDFDFEKYLNAMLGAIGRGLFCKHCGVCKNVCKRSAIRDNPETGMIVIDIDACAGITCQQCTWHCPVYHVVKDNIITDERLTGG